MSDNIYTEDLGDIISCSLKRRKVMQILNAWDKNGLPDDFSNSGVKVAINRNSGFVFLVNEEYQCCMELDGELQSFYTTPYEGKEGFWAELVEEYPTMHHDDQEYMRDISNGRDLPEVTA
jgi:hypothetical protein